MTDPREMCDYVKRQGKNKGQQCREPGKREHAYNWHRGDSGPVIVRCGKHSTTDGAEYQIDCPHCGAQIGVN